MGRKWLGAWRQFEWIQCPSRGIPPTRNLLFYVPWSFCRLLDLFLVILRTGEAIGFMVSEPSRGVRWCFPIFLPGKLRVFRPLRERLNWKFSLMSKTIQPTWLMPATPPNNKTVLSDYQVDKIKRLRYKRFSESKCKFQHISAFCAFWEPIENLRIGHRFSHY